MMKNSFYFTLKALFLLKIFKFCVDFFVIQKNGLIGQIKLISKFMAPQPGKQTISIHILPNISRNKGNHKMKFSQLIEFNMRKFSLEKSYTKCGGETISTPFSKNLKLSISLDQQSKVLYSLFLLGYRNLSRLSCSTLAFTS